MIYLNNLSEINYDFDEFSYNVDMSNKLFCTFCAKDELDDLLEQITANYIILYEKIFVLECQDQKEFICTYNVDFNNVGDFLPNTILVHRKKHTNTLYTINALNELIKSLNNGFLDKRYMVDWNEYKNSVLLTKDFQLQILKTSLYQIIEI